jgi:hypothetical protein
MTIWTFKKDSKGVEVSKNDTCNAYSLGKPKVSLRAAISNMALFFATYDIIDLSGNKEVFTYKDAKGKTQKYRWNHIASIFQKPVRPDGMGN